MPRQLREEDLRAAHEDLERYDKLREALDVKSWTVLEALDNGLLLWRIHAGRRLSMIVAARGQEAIDATNCDVRAVGLAILREEPDFAVSLIEMLLAAYSERRP